MKVLIATGNQDKFNRIKRWINKDLELYSFNDLDPIKVELGQLTHDEESSFPNLDSKAIAKVEKAWKVFGEEYLILATDDGAYFPWIDTEVLELRKPQKLYKNGVEIHSGTNERLHGLEISDLYADLVDKIATEELMQSKIEELRLNIELTYKFMPVEWRFALVGAYKDSAPEIIYKWTEVEYITNLRLPENTTDTGYMIGRIAVTTPGMIPEGLPAPKNETQPIPYVNEYIEKMK